MTESEIIEGNRLINEFMVTRNTKYNERWDWLMPVVEKIEGLFNESLIMTILHTKCTIEVDTQMGMAYNVHLPENFYSTEKTKIIAVYKSAISFIQWYNSVKTK